MTTLLLTITLTTTLAVFAIDTLRKRRDYLSDGKK
jgi:hypothetical protein